jgi:molybdopterin-guanine dinucleotide biosynthesis protein A
MPASPWSSGEHCTALEYALDSLWTVTDEIFVILGPDPDLSVIERIAPYGVKVIIESNDSSDGISGIASGMKAARSEHVLITRGDTPFLKPNVVLQLFAAAKGYDAAIPRWKDQTMEAYLAVYCRKTLLKVIERLGLTGSLETIISNLYTLRYLDIESELREVDPELQSFQHVTASENEEFEDSLGIGESA